MTEILVSPLAMADLQDAADYLSSQLHNPGAAARLIERIRNAVSQLQWFPELGTPITVAGQSVTYRYLLCGSYMVFYHLENAVVHIDRLLYGRRDYLTLLFGAVLPEEE